jgi:2-hydroxychromene-2-carboxylate isomerase
MDIKIDIMKKYGFYALLIAAVMYISLFTQMADSLGLDTVQFKLDFNNPKIYEKIGRNIQMLHDKKFYGTPTLVIGNKMYVNIKNAQRLTQLIDKQLSK